MPSPKANFQLHFTFYQMKFGFLLGIQKLRANAVAYNFWIFLYFFCIMCFMFTKPPVQLKKNVKNSKAALGEFKMAERK